MLKPFFMWAGGKSKMWKHYQPLLPSPDKFSCYVEPFLGGGAMYGNYGYQFSKTVLNDVNREIMCIYADLCENPTVFIVNVWNLVDSYFKIPSDKESRKSFYYELRQEYWRQPYSELLYVLMRLGFNGIWQTCKDSNGLFGTPAGLLNHIKPEQVFNPELLHQWSIALTEASLNCADYAALGIRDNSFIFCDPPYRDSFTRYSTDFDDPEQHRLIMWMKQQVEHGNTVAFSNRTVVGENFFEEVCAEFDFHYFPVTYTAGRRKKTDDGYEAKKAVEFLAISR